ncbi:MAG: PD40 domain-containing protein [Chloroflexi bacterium]|nr:PD40 domain-containing protein [Chloroflexota bacterium]
MTSDAIPLAQETLLLKQPTVSADHIAFLYASDIWIAGRDGRHPRRLTAHKGVKSTPMFSPDGEWIAFSANYDGNTSVYVIGKEGGSPRRLTFHPGDDWVRGWTPDGRAILFVSSRDAHTIRYRRFFTVSLEGDFPQALPLPMAERGDFSPDGRFLAYTSIPEPFWSWKRYRGGRTSPIWVLDLTTYDHVEIPHVNASDTFPCWLDDTIYFLSDRHGTMNLFTYHTQTTAVTQLTHYDDFDIRSLTAGDGLLAYEQNGRIHLYNPTDGQTTTLHIQIAADLPYARPYFKRAAHTIRYAGISPTGMRAVFEARGDIFTVPAKKGDIRNLTRTPGVHERFPAWSPDGQQIAYFSDASGEYELVLSDQTGLHEKTFIPLGKKSFFYSPTWSPDSQKIAYTDKALNLYYLDVAEQKPIHVTTDTYDHPERSLNPVWSPDSQWLAYTRRLDTHIRAVFLYELATGVSHQITDGLSDATSACFSPDGKYLFFAASSNYGLNTGWLDMSSYERPVQSSLYVVVLSHDTPSPLAPESDDEPANEKKSPDETNADEAKNGGDEQDQKEKKQNGQKKPPVEVKIDLGKMDQRILALPLPAREFRSLQAANGKLFYLETNQSFAEQTEALLGTLNVFDLKERKNEVYLSNIRAYWISADGRKLLYQSKKPDDFAVIGTDKKPDNGGDRLNLAHMEVYVDPKAEWAQMFTEVCRLQRDFFYDAHMHGLDWEATAAKYRPLLTHVGHRQDLNFILAELIGELSVGHAYVMFGDIPTPNRVGGGLLGADYDLVDGFYRFRRIYSGLNWHPELRAPLTEPGVNVSEGDYLLAVNGRSLRAPTNLYSLFEKTADKQTALLVSPTTDAADGRIVTVVPIPSENDLRHWSWVENNRQKVSEMTNGRVAYVYMSNTALEGYASFNRYYFSQLDKEAVILDERFNGGGSVADYVIDLLNRPLLSYWATREGKIFSTPAASIFGPKVMVINEFAGSGGDAMPQFFRRRGLGKLVGKRTWGGLIGIYDNPVLLDGGLVTVPRLAIFSPEGEWEVENEGVAPDVEVEMTPKLVINGRDPQLETAVEIILAELAAHPRPKIERPAPATR